MTPHTHKKNQIPQEISFTIVNCPLGYLLIAGTSKGICLIRLADDKSQLLTQLKQLYTPSQLTENAHKLKKWTQPLLSYLKGTQSWPALPYDVQATPFQRTVWEWLRSIPPGKTYHYSEVAKAIGKPNATRAVAHACATNPVALIVPCHRILPKSGGIGGYRWKQERKQKLLEIESISHNS